MRWHVRVTTCSFFGFGCPSAADTDIQITKMVLMADEAVTLSHSATS